MSHPPPCSALGRQCRELRLTLRIADFTEDSAAERDAAATWLLGHTERIAFGTPYRQEGLLLVDAVVRVGCKYLVPGSGGGEDGDGAVRCRAHGYEGGRPSATRPSRVPAYRLSEDRFTVYHRGHVREMTLPVKTHRPRRLPVLQENPCASARCRTADNTIGAACCRDLTLDVVVPLGDERTELLLRSRRAPYLCKVKRTDESVIEVEAISACGYLDPDDHVSCVLHERVLPDGTSAKPEICFDWPDFDKDDEDFTGHPGCVFLT